MRHRVGSVHDFEPGTIEIVDVDSRSIGIVNAGDGTFYAVLNVCPHALAEVCRGTLSGTLVPCEPGKPRYGMQNRILRCPWHRYEFDLADGGKCVFTSYKARLRMFPVVIDGGGVFVEIKSRTASQPAASARS